MSTPWFEVAEGLRCRTLREGDLKMHLQHITSSYLEGILRSQPSKKTTWIAGSQCFYQSTFSTQDLEVFGMIVGWRADHRRITGLQQSTFQSNPPKKNNMNWFHLLHHETKLRMPSFQRAGITSVVIRAGIYVTELVSQFFCCACSLGEQSHQGPRLDLWDQLCPSINEIVFSDTSDMSDISHICPGLWFAKSIFQACKESDPLPIHRT